MTFIHYSYEWREKIRYIWLLITYFKLYKFVCTMENHE